MISAMLVLAVGVGSARAGTTCSVLVLTGDDARVESVSLASGARTTVVSGASVDVSAVRGLVVDSTHGWLCADGKVVSVALADGAVAVSGVSCAGIGGGEEVVVLDPSRGPSNRHASMSAAMNPESTPSGAAHLHNARAATVGPSWVATASAASPAVHLFSRDSGDLLRTLAPTTVTPPIWGLSAVGDTLYVLDDGRQPDGSRQDPAIRELSSESGAEVSSVSLTLAVGEKARGLSCSAE